MDITPYLKLMLEKQASDIFLTANSPVKIKIEGQAAPVGKTVLSGELTQKRRLCHYERAPAGPV